MNTFKKIVLLSIFGPIAFCELWMCYDASTQLYTAVKDYNKTVEEYNKLNLEIIKYQHAIRILKEKNEF
jgi:hypothetical protein